MSRLHCMDAPPDLRCISLTDLSGKHSFYDLILLCSADFFFIKISTMNDSFSLNKRRRFCCPLFLYDSLVTVRVAYGFLFLVL